MKIVIGVHPCKLSIVLLPVLLLLFATPVIAQEEIAIRQTVVLITGEEEHLMVTEYHALVNRGSQEYSGELYFSLPEKAFHIHVLGLSSVTILPGLLRGEATLPPGESEVFLHYYLPYPYPKLAKQINYPTEQFHLIIPPQLNVSGPLFSPPKLIEIRGSNFYQLTAFSLQPGMVISASLSGPKGGVPGWSTPLALGLAVLAFLAPFAYLRYRTKK